MSSLKTPSVVIACAIVGAIAFFATRELGAQQQAAPVADPANEAFRQQLIQRMGEMYSLFGRKDDIFLAGKDIDLAHPTLSGVKVADYQDLGNSRFFIIEGKDNAIFLIPASQIVLVRQAK